MDLLHLFNISHFSTTCCIENSSLINCPNTMAKRMQEQKGEERSVTKSKSTATTHVLTSSSSAKSPIASQNPGTLVASGKPESRMRRNSKSAAASSSQVRLQDAYFGGMMDTATGKLPRAAPCAVSRSLVSHPPRKHGSIPSRFASCCCVVCASLFHSPRVVADVAVFSTLMAIIAPRAHEWEFWASEASLWSQLWHGFVGKLVG